MGTAHFSLSVPGGKSSSGFSLESHMVLISTNENCHGLEEMIGFTISTLKIISYDFNTEDSLGLKVCKSQIYKSGQAGNSSLADQGRNVGTCCI